MGVDEKLPRTPALYKAKVRQRKLSDDEEDAEPTSSESYLSVKANKKVVREQFEQEVEMGAMMKMTEGVAIEQLGKDLVVAAVSAIEEAVTADTTFRVNHDGMHDVKVRSTAAYWSEICAATLGTEN